MMEIPPVRIQPIEAAWLQQQRLVLHVLRLDEVHPVVSGNKWFKLQYYLKDAIAKNLTTIATFGGAYSNHIVATAFACKEMGLNSIGVIRGEAPQTLSHTLLQAREYGMRLEFVSRQNFKTKEVANTLPQAYWIGEGGYGTLGAQGAAGIAGLVKNFESYSHLILATGTGTTMAGLLQSALPHQTVIGFSALKNNVSITEEIKALLSIEDKQKLFLIRYDSHFGGYAKYTPLLLKFINETWHQHSLPLDFVYTAKAFYGLQDMIENHDIIPNDGRVLFIHTGGLQGNLSLPAGALSFS